MLHRLRKVRGALTEFIEQPRILDCDNSLCGEVLHQCYLFFDKRTDFPAVDTYTADKRAPSKHWHSKKGTHAAEFDELYEISTPQPMRSIVMAVENVQ